MVTATDTTLGVYQAFQLSTTSQHALWLRIKKNDIIPQTAPSFSYVKNMAIDWSGTWIVLMFADLMNVELYGRKMEELFQHMLSHKVAWVQEFDHSIWKEPAKDQPCITKIKIQPVGKQKLLEYDPSRLN